MKALNMTMMAGILMSTMGHVSAAKFDINPLAQSTLPMDRGCELSVNTPVIDYGTQSRWQLQDVAGGQKLTTGKRNFTLNIVCPYHQAMRVVLRGGRSHEGELRYGERGHVSLRVVDAILDGQPIELSSMMTDGMIKSTSENILYLKPGMGMIATRNGQVVNGKILTTRFEVEPMMAEQDAHVSSPLINEANFSLELIK